MGNERVAGASRLELRLLSRSLLSSIPPVAMLVLYKDHGEADHIHKSSFIY